VLGRIGFVARSGAQSIADSSTDRRNPQQPSSLPAAPAGETMPSAFTGDPFGYNKARRDWARQLNIDPYTTNPVLRPLLDNAAAASLAGSGLRRIKMSAMVPVGVKVDESLVIAAAVDYVYWDVIAAEFAQRKTLSGKRRVLLLAGNASPRATQDLERAGTMRTGLRP